MRKRLKFLPLKEICCFSLQAFIIRSIPCNTTPMVGKDIFQCNSIVFSYPELGLPVTLQERLNLNTAWQEKDQLAVYTSVVKELNSGLIWRQLLDKMFISSCSRVMSSFHPFISSYHPFFSSSRRLISTFPRLFLPSRRFVLSSRRLVLSSCSSCRVVMSS